MSYQRYSQSFQTTNATPTVAISIPIPELSSADITVEFSVKNTAYTSGGKGEVTALFIRASGGNVVRATGSAGTLDATLNLISNFLTFPKANLTANTGTQTADLVFTGLAATTLNWEFAINVKRG